MGALPSAGPISISQIRQELVTSDGSLRGLSARASKGTPDSMSEFRGYQWPTATVNMSQNTGQLYDGCSMSMDGYGWFDSTDPNFGGQGPFGGNFISSTERGANAGTFLTFGGNVSATVHGSYGVTIVASSNGYGVSPCQPIFSFINVNGNRVANTNTNAGYTEIAYSFTANPGTTYNVEIGLGYGSV
jgi:hypothetical protein